MEENKIVDKIKNGDNSEFNYLYEKYRNKIYAYFMKKLADPDIADELTQRTFIKMYENIDKFNKNKSPFYNFVWMSVKQVMIDYIRSKKTKKSNFEKNTVSFDEINENDIANKDEDIREEEREAVNDMMEDLSDYQRTVLELFYFENKSEKEIAKIVGKGDGAVRSVVHRAKKTLEKLAIAKHPEIAGRYITKMVIMLAIGLTAVTGLVYATYKIYNEIIGNKYTLSKLREEVPETESIISKEVALDKMNYYLDVLGEDKVSIDDIKLVRNLGKGKICWMFTGKSGEIKIDSVDATLVTYSNFNANGVTIENDINFLYEKLGLPSDYKLYRDEKLSTSRILEYAKNYGEIYNKFESVKIIISKDKVESITTFDYPYKENEIIISKEKALEIAIENGIDVKNIQLSIENIGDEPIYSKDEVYENINSSNYQVVELDKLDFKIKKVWKIIDNNNAEIFIDVEDGKIIYNLETTFEEKEE